MNLGFSTPAWLWLLPFVLWLPLRRLALAPSGYPWNPLLPADPLSRAVEWLVRIAGMAALASLVLGLAGLHRREIIVERIGHGAHVALLLDRSRSMDDSFAGKAPIGAEESKSAAAERLLREFVAARPHDRFGAAAFSTSPLFVLPLTGNRDAVDAAIRAITLPGLAQTHVSKGLGMAASLFQGSDPGAARIVLLVSDGAAAIDPHAETLLRRWYTEQRLRLYWIFLRTAGSPGIFETPPPEDDTPQSRPELYLHRFFSGLGIPYKAYEAENPDGLRAAIADIGRLENQPLRYTERQPRLDFSAWLYRTAALFLLILCVVKRLEVERCPQR